MPTVFSHAIVALTLGKAAGVERRALVWGAGLAMLPDADVLALPFDAGFGGLFGHRGLTHSLAFAGVAAALAAAALRNAQLPGGSGRRLFCYLFAAIALHGLFDAMTDGGSGIAFFAPFSSARYFLPWRPIEVSPLGAGFFSTRGAEVILNEALWIGLPCAAALAVKYALSHALSRSAARAETDASAHRHRTDTSQDT